MMTILEVFKRRRERKRQRAAEEAGAFAEHYVSTYGKQRPKPADKMRRKPEDK